MKLAERRVESTTLLLEAGKASTRDRLEAEDALVRARNANDPRARRPRVGTTGAQLRRRHPRGWARRHLDSGPARPGFAPGPRAGSAVGRPRPARGPPSRPAVGRARSRCRPPPTGRVAPWPRRAASPFVLLLLLVLPLALGLVVVRVPHGRRRHARSGARWTTAERGRLRVTVLEGGSLEALKSHTVTSKVEGQAAILYIVEEGTVLTRRTSTAGKVIVQLDSAGIEEKLERQKIDLASARASYENAISNLEIQRQTERERHPQGRARCPVRSPRSRTIRRVRPRRGPAGGSPPPRGPARGRRDVRRCHGAFGRGRSPGRRRDADSGSPPSGLRRLILTLLESDDLEGEARQTVRRARLEHRPRRGGVHAGPGGVDWSLKLEEKGYVSRDEEEADRIALERRRSSWSALAPPQKQFAIYDFPKEVESLLSDLVEAEDQLSRTRKRAQSAEAKTLADVESRREQHTLQEARNVKLTTQLSACVIRPRSPASWCTPPAAGAVAGIGASASRRAPRSASASRSSRSPI